MSRQGHLSTLYYYPLDADHDDEDDSIVYGEQPQQNLLPSTDRERSASQEMSQCSSTGGSGQQTATMVMNANHTVDDRDHDTSTTTSITTAFISRDERRKRRREWQRRKSVLSPTTDETLFPLFPDADPSDGESEEQNSTSMENNSNDNNTFASLQALLQESSPPSPSHEPQERQIENMIDRQDTIMDPISNARTETSMSRGGEPLEPSPPDFCMNYDDDDDSEEQEVDCASLVDEQRRGDRPLTKGKNITIGKKRKEKERTIRGIAKRARSCPPPTPQFATPQSPLGARKRQRRPHSLGSRNAETAVSPPLSRPITTPVIPDSKTIVGMRPTHWQRARSSQPQLAQSQPMASRMNLKAATRRPVPTFEKVSSSSVNAAGAVFPRSKDLAWNLRRKENISNNQQNSGTITTEQLRKMTYHPQNMPKPRTSTDIFPSPIVPHDDATATNSSSMAVTIDRPSFSITPTTNASSRRYAHHRSPKSGPWTTRLAAIKSHQTNDAMKLQHPGMNRQHQHGILFDLNDPRKKAKWLTDVTILSDHENYETFVGGATTTKRWSSVSAITSGTASSRGGDESLLTVLGHIHHHAPTGSTNNHNQGSAGGRHETVVSTTAALGWISFTHTTARNIGLCKGMELRLYDAVLLPVPRIVAGSEGGPPPRDEDEIAEMDCRSFHVICTQLCEKHPRKLDPVPNFYQGESDIANNLQGLQK